MSTNELLQALITEVKGLREDMVKQAVDTCKAKEALIISGLTNPVHLTYFVDKGILTRVGSGNKTGYTYYKSELVELSRKIKSGSVRLPKIKEIYSKP